MLCHESDVEELMCFFVGIGPEIVLDLLRPCSVEVKYCYPRLGGNAMHDLSDGEIINVTTSF